MAAGCQVELVMSGGRDLVLNSVIAETLMMDSYGIRQSPTIEDSASWHRPRKDDIKTTKDYHYTTWIGLWRIYRSDNVMHGKLV
jgi:hypothetical protein